MYICVCVCYVQETEISGTIRPHSSPPLYIQLLRSSRNSFRVCLQCPRKSSSAEPTHRTHCNTPVDSISQGMSWKHETTAPQNPSFFVLFFFGGGVGESLSSNCFASRAPNGSFPILQPKGTQWSCLWTGNGLTSSAGGGGHRSGSESSGRWVGSPSSPANRRSALVQRWAAFSYLGVWAKGLWLESIYYFDYYHLLTKCP